jgi:ferredoxin-NADP reductase
VIFRGKVLVSRALTPSTHMIRVEKAPGFAFRPVQFCGLEIMTSEGGEEYPMSLACSPTKPYLEFGARLSDSPWKQAFAALRPGDEVEVDGAYGHFVLDESRDALFVAGGIGITPLKGMAEYLADAGSPRRAVLVYSNRSQDEIAYRDELAALEAQNPRFRVVHTLTREPATSDWAGRRGRIDAKLLQEAAADLADPACYLCGKGEMVMGAGQQLLDMGVPRERIVFEVFRGYG